MLPLFSPLSLMLETVVPAWWHLWIPMQPVGFFFFFHAIFRPRSPGLWYRGETISSLGTDRFASLPNSKEKIEIGARSLPCLMLSFSSSRALFWSERTMRAAGIVWRAEERACKVGQFATAGGDCNISEQSGGDIACLSSLGRQPSLYIKLLGVWRCGNFRGIAAPRSTLACFQTPHVSIKAVHTSNIIQKKCFRPYASIPIPCSMEAWQREKKDFIKK